MLRTTTDSTMNTDRSKPTLRIKRGVFPSGEEYFSVEAPSQRVGAFSARDGGFVPFGCTKPLPTMEDAARACLRSMVRNIEQGLKPLRALLEAPIELPAPPEGP